MAKQRKSKGRVVDFNKALEEREKKRQAEHEEPVEISEQSEASVKRKKRQHNRKLGIYMLVIVAMLVIVGVLAHNVIALKVEESELKSRITELEKQKKALQEEKQTGTDSDYIESQARKQLRMIKPGEILYILPDEENEE